MTRPGRRWLRPLDGLGHDVRYGARQLRRAPAFTAVALLTLALGIGANTALFSLIDAALFKRLPVPHPEQLVSAIVRTPSGGWMTNVPSVLFDELRGAPRAFSGVIAFWQRRTTVRWNADSEQALVQHVSGAYYATLGVRAFVGRLIEPADDTPDGGAVAVLGYDFWTRRFGADPAIVGRTVVVSGTPRAIVGVTPRGFFGTDRSASPDVSVPLGDPSKLANLWVMARRHGHTGLEQARAETELAWQRSLERLRPSLGRLRKSQRDEMLAQRADLLPADRAAGRLGMRAPAEPLRILLVLSAVVLLIACANLANLLTTRAAARSVEIGTRLAIGASRARLVRQLLVESLLLASIGGVMGLAFGFWAHRLLVVFMIGDVVPAGVAFTLDARLLFFTTAVSLATALLFGLAPALRVARLELVQALKRDARPRGLGGKGLVVAQVAACVVLLAAGTLLARTLANLRTLDRGFGADNVLLIAVGVGEHRRSGAAVAAFYHDLIAGAEAIPGVVSASLGADALFGGGGWRKNIWVEGRPAEERQSAALNAVAPGFFETAGMPLVAGRDFTPHDRVDTSRVAIVNEAFARAYCPQGAAIGCRFRDSRQDATGRFEVVGMVTDARHGSLRDAPEPTVYEALMQEERPSAVTLHVRTRGHPALVVPRLRDELRHLDPTLPVHTVRTLAQQIDSSLRQERMMATLSGFFALLALFVTCIGLFGTVAHGVERRTREIGIRVALGARRGHVLRVVLGRTLLLVGVGAAIGVGLALASTRTLESLLFGLSPADPLAVGGSVAVLLAVAALACYLPARRAASLDPMVALRRE